MPEPNMLVGFASVEVKTKDNPDWHNITVSLFYRYKSCFIWKDASGNHGVCLDTDYRNFRQYAFPD